jgi:SAM-dependent methyltransferase
LYGFQSPRAAEIQHFAFRSILHEMYAGKARDDFTAVAAAVSMTSLVDPLIIEVGCASGWNFEVLSYLLNRPVRYIGLDYSSASIRLGKQCYPHASFVIGDAIELPIRDGACDILLSGTVLMHLWGYERAIQESRRVSRKWCIFHTVTVMQGRPTTFLRKLAYGSPVIEVVFNQQHLLSLFEDNGLILRHTLDSIPYDLSEHLGERSFSKTYVCEIARK